jgi:hypothetical protein
LYLNTTAHHSPDLLDLVGIGIVAFPLKIDPLLDSRLAENVMPAL